MNQLGDLISIQTADGEEVFFDTQVYAVIDTGHFGAPPTEFITRRGYRQHGVSEVDYFLGARDIPFELWRKEACDRDEYWANRAALLDLLRPNRTGPMTLTVRRPDDSLRSIIIRANPGPTFPPGASENNNWALQEAIELIAFNPIWFDYAATDLTLNAATQTELVFPITFPISFGTSNEQFTTGSLTYTGTWYEYPTITLTGPYTTAAITHLQTGATIFLSVAISAGQQRIITLTPGAQSITDANGNNRFSDLGPLSNLVGFNLRPDPEIPGGVQEISVTMVDGTGASGASMSYRNRYFGI